MASTTNTSPYGSVSQDVAQALDELQQDESHYVPQREAKELFIIENAVQIFFISPEGKVSTFSAPTTLRIFEFKEQLQDQGETWKPVFIQVGGWTHPLVPGASPVLEASNGAFMFPDVYADQPGASVGIVLSTESEEVREQLRNLLEQYTALKSNEPLPKDQQLGTIGKTMVNVAEVVAQGLEKGAEKACHLIEYVGEKQKDSQVPAEQDAKINPALKYSITGAKYATYATVKVSGFVATRVGKLTKRLADHLASKIEKPVTGAVVSTTGGSGNMRQSVSLRSFVDAARGGLIAYGTVYSSLEDSAKVLGGCLKDQSVSVVQHRYGQEAGGVYGSAMSAAGNAAMTYLNVQSLGVKGLVKRTAKDTAKNVGHRVLDAHTEKKANAE